MSANEAALVTGSSKGLGAAISRVLAERGYYVYITDHDDHPAAEQTADDLRSIGRQAEVLPLDVTSESSVRDGFAVIGRSDHRLAVLVNNAATEVARNIEEATFAGVDVGDRHQARRFLALHEVRPSHAQGSRQSQHRLRD